MIKILRQSLFVTIVIASFASAAHAQTSTTLAWDEGAPSMVNGYAVTVDGVRKDYGLSPATSGSCGCSVSLPISGGKHTIVVSAYNASGETAALPIVTAPVANAGGPYSGTVGTALAVSGSLSSDPTGTIVTYQWTWGDGTSSSGSSPSASHAYSASGSFPVTLTVTDNGGATSSASTAATIAASGSSGGGGTVTKPSVSSETPTSGATGVATSTTVAATFSTTMSASTLTTSTFTLRSSSNTAVAATVAYNSSTLTATLTPNAALAAGATYTATIKGGTGGAADTASNTLASDVVWSFTTATSTSNSNPTPTTNCPCSLWTTSTNAGDEDPEAASLELGMKFTSDVAGYITGIRFYKYAHNTGTHVGNLWSSNGALLGTVTFSNETSSGWQQATFSKPIPIAAKTTYVISYHTNSGRYASTENGFSSAVNAGPLHGLASSGGNGNGVYAQGSRSVFPTQSWHASNYWVDVVFTP